MKRLFSFIFLVMIIFSVYPKVIITHGVLGHDCDWYKPGGYFYEQVAKIAKKFNQEVIPFSWDQGLAGISHKERIKAGAQLAKIIVDLKSGGEEQIILIGHSYGGHVIKVASQILGFSKNNLKEELGGDLITDLELIGAHILSDVYDLNKDRFFIETAEAFYQYKEKALKNNRAESEFIVDSVYTLGTPNNIPDYQANMKVVRYLYNFYSDGDLIQDIVGDKLLPKPQHERAVNLAIKIKGTGWFGLWGKPTHIEMHAETIAHWILLIPFALKLEGVGGFDNFSFENDGTIYFIPGEIPTYSQNLFGAKEDGFFAVYDIEWLKRKFSFISNLC